MLRFISMLSLVLLGVGCAADKDRYVGVDEDYLTGTPLPERVEGANFMGDNVTKGQYAPVYFSYDSYTVESDQLDKIREMARAFEDINNQVIIAGFTDERGTEEYNRALGERRALAVRQELIAAGVPANQLQTVSFGEELPADPGGGEAAWAMNRRAEFGVVE